MAERLTPNSSDDSGLVIAVHQKLVITQETFKRVTDRDLRVPEWLDADFKRFDTVRLRQARGDHRSTETERKSVKAIAQWVLDIYRSLRGQESTQLKWKE